MATDVGRRSQLALALAAGAGIVIGLGLVVAAGVLQLEANRGVVVPQGPVEEADFYDRINRIFALIQVFGVVAPAFVAGGVVALVALLGIRAVVWERRRAGAGEVERSGSA